MLRLKTLISFIKKVVGKTMTEIVYGALIGFTAVCVLVGVAIYFQRRAEAKEADDETLVPLYLKNEVLEYCTENSGVDCEHIAERFGISHTEASDILEELLKEGKLDFLE